MPSEREIRRINTMRLRHGKNCFSLWGKKGGGSPLLTNAEIRAYYARMKRLRK